MRDSDLEKTFFDFVDKIVFISKIEDTKIVNSEKMKLNFIYKKLVSKAKKSEDKCIENNLEALENVYRLFGGK